MLAVELDEIVTPPGSTDKRSLLLWVEEFFTIVELSTSVGRAYFWLYFIKPVPVQAQKELSCATKNLTGTS